MSRQEKAVTERHAKTLRELLKRPENKVCADCKRNDPRWASWNIGVFLCIRCSGIHRSMGTHISRVKSVDLDIWTPEQMASVQKWGNRRANAYWEAHLKAGHVPADHKIESFIRSKYDSRRWALDGPPPSDPSVFDEAVASSPATSSATVPLVPPVVSQTSRPTLVDNISTRQAAPPVTTRQPQPHQLLSAAVADRSQQPKPVSNPATPSAQAQSQPQAPPNDLFSLDFHSVSSSAVSDNSTQASAPKKDVKQDILSLFSSPSAVAPTPSPSGFGSFGAAPPQPTQWGQTANAGQAYPQSQNTSMMGANGAGMWGVSSGWNAAPAPPAQGNLWSGAAQVVAPPQSQDLFASDDVWGAPAVASGTSNSSFTTTTQKKDDAFGDLWGGFK